LEKESGIVLNRVESVSCRWKSKKKKKVGLIRYDGGGVCLRARF
jgi:hypothetical protein